MNIRLGISSCSIAISLLLCAGMASADSIVVVVSSNNPVQHLSQNDISQIFLDKAEFFPDGTPASPVNYASKSKMATARSQFEDSVLGKSPNQMRAYWSRLVFTGTGKIPREIVSPEDLKDLIKTAPGTIGYLDKSLVDTSMKVVYQP